jgi:type VI secretion system protein ImpJ
MALDPHHFQQWDRYHAHLLQARMHASTPHAWGLTHLEIDEDALANGTVRIVRCGGVTSDGLVFDIPDSDPAPAARAAAEHFPPTADRLTLFVAVPAERARGVNFLLPHAEAQRETRYLVERVAVVDEVGGLDEREIEIARPNIALRFASEPGDSFSLLPVAQLVRTPTGGFRLARSFVPPCTTVGASAALRATTRRVLELLVAKSTALWGRTRRLPRGQAPMSAADVVSLSLQTTVNAFIPLLRHHHAAGDSHPETLYRTLAMLAGQLSALPGNVDVDVRTLPTYQHANLGPCFATLDRVIGTLLKEEIGENYTTIPLERRDDLHVGTPGVDLLAGGATFYLIGSGIAPGTERAIPDQLRVAAPTVIRQVVQGFLRALAIEWEPRPPTGAPAGADLHYFRLASSGPFWDDIRARGSLAIHVPRHLEGIKLQLIAIRAAP